MDWLTVLWLAIIVVSVIFMFVIDRYLKKRRNNRRLGLGDDVPIGDFTDSLSSESGLQPKFGGGSGGGAGTTRSFAASGDKSPGVADTRIIPVNSIVSGEFTGDRVPDGISGDLLLSKNSVASIIEPTAAIDTVVNQLSTTIDAEAVVTSAVEFMSDAAGNAIEVAGEIVSEIISS